MMRPDRLKLRYAQSMDEPTATLTPTETLTPTPTYTPTLAVYVETVLSEGQGARFERTTTAGEYTTNTLLFVIIALMVGQFMYTWLKDWGKK